MKCCEKELFLPATKLNSNFDLQADTYKALQAVFNQLQYRLYSFFFLITIDKGKEEILYVLITRNEQNARS